MDISLCRIILFGVQIDKLKHFYIDNFNLELLEEIKDEWVVLKSGGIEIALHKIGEAYVLATEQFNGESNIKLVFKINHDLQSFRQKLLDNGVFVQDIKSFKGINSLFCDGQDIEGNVFQVEQPLG